MKKLFPALFIVMIFVGTACKKTKIDLDNLSGIWVEKTLRLDTLDFDRQHQAGLSLPSVYLRSRPYNDPALNPNYPINHSNIYQYYFSGDTMHLRSFVSSSSLYVPFHCELVAGAGAIRIAKFYNRQSLPSVIEFQKIN
ncbi:MAG: hypothetical protein V4722_22550 [Bacteroidota bacterium]